MPNTINLRLLDNKNIIAELNGIPLAQENSYKIVAGEENATIFKIASKPTQYEEARYTVEMVNSQGSGIDETDIIEDTFALPIGMAVAGYGWVQIRAYQGLEVVPFMTLKVKVWNTLPDWKQHISSGSNITVDAELNETSTNPVQNKVIYDKFQQLEEALYKPIDITSFTVSPSSSEKGSTVTSVTLSWKTNKTPTNLTLDNATISNSLTSTTLTGLSLSATKRYELVATDEKGATDTAYAYIFFYNGVYYGVATEPTSYDRSFILGLTKSLQGTKAKTFTVTAGEGQYIYYCLPSSGYGTPNFNVGGFDGGFEKVSTISFTNASGYTENYDIYRSDNANLGDTTVKVS